MLKVLVYLFSAAVGFIIAMVLFPQNKELQSIMEYRANCADDFYDRIYKRKG